MNQKIETPVNHDQQQREFSPIFVRWMVMLTITTLLMVFFHIDFPSVVSMLFRSAPDRLTTWLAFFPWVMAGGFTISQGISEFSTGIPRNLSPAEEWVTLLGLIVAYVIAPTVVLFLWRNLHNRKEEGTTQVQISLRPSNIVFGIAVAFIIIIIVQVLPAAYVEHQVLVSMKKSTAIQANKDDIMNEMLKIGWDGYQYRILPPVAGGGGDSYRGYTLRPGMSATQSGNYSVLYSSKDTILIKGSSNLNSGNSVTCLIDSAGQLRNFRYYGDFF